MATADKAPTAESGLEDGEIESDVEVSVLSKLSIGFGDTEISKKLSQQCFSPSDDVNIIDSKRSDFNSCEGGSKYSKGLPRIYTDDVPKHSQLLNKLEDLDEYEMLCIRGGSPPAGFQKDCSYFYDTKDLVDEGSTNYFDVCSVPYSYESDESYGHSQSPPNRRRRIDRSRRRKKKSKRKQLSNEKLSCHQTNSPDENYSEEETVEYKKLEICKFYLMDCCIKRRICHYMHSDFPCKYYYLGLECENEKPCKFLHGKALTEEMKNALVRHIIAAPRTILGNFKRMSKEKIIFLLETKNSKLLNTDHEEKVSETKADINVTDVSKNLELREEFDNNNLEIKSSTQIVLDEENWDLDDKIEAGGEAFITKDNFSSNQENNGIWTVNFENQKRYNSLMCSNITRDDISTELDNIWQTNDTSKCEENNTKEQYHEFYPKIKNVEKSGEEYAEVLMERLENFPEDCKATYARTNNEYLKLNYRNTEYKKDSLRQELDNSKICKELSQSENAEHQSHEIIMQSVPSPTWGQKKSAGSQGLDVDETDIAISRLFDESSDDDEYFKLKNYSEILSESQIARLSELKINSYDLGNIQQISQSSSTEYKCPALEYTEMLKKQPDQKDSDMRIFRGPADLRFLDEDIDFCTSPSDANRSSEDITSKLIWTESFSSNLSDSLNVLDELSTHDLMDDETKLVIDESVLSDDMKSKNTDSDTEDNSKDVESDRASYSERFSTWHGINNNDSAKKDDYKLGKSYAPLQVGDDLTFSERLDKDIKSSKLTTSNGDFDIRLPFTPITLFLPATEIEASISSHPVIEYKLTEIYIPEKDFSSVQTYPPLSDQCLIDPRLKRIVQIKNNKTLESIPEKNSINEETFSRQILEQNSNVNSKYPVKLSSSFCLDPRKRKESFENTPAQKNVPNYTSILNGHLQKSKWYQDLKSHVKIYINEMLAKLSLELSRFHQNASPNKCFELWAIDGADKIDEILFKLGIYVDQIGKICDMNNHQKELSSNNGTDFSVEISGVNGIPSLLTLNVADPPVQFNRYPRQQNHMSSAPPVNVGLMPARLDLPKPGLLGIAPGLEYPIFQGISNGNMMRFKNSTAGFQNQLLQQRWSNRPPFFTPVPPVLSFDMRHGSCDNPPDSRRRWHLDRKNKNNNNNKRLRRS